MESRLNLGQKTNPHALQVRGKIRKEMEDFHLFTPIEGCKETQTSS